MGQELGNAEIDITAERLNWLRAGVLGANDGIVSTAGLVLGVAGATDDGTAILTAGLAGLIAGSLSMALGEYVSVSTQRDAERSVLRRERRALARDPEREFEELVGLYQEKGLTEPTARQVATELTAHDALAAHLDVGHRLSADDFVSPWSAAAASATSFVVGALLPLLAMVLPPEGWRLPVTAVAVLVALVLTGWLSARLSRGRPRRGDPGPGRRWARADPDLPDRRLLRRLRRLTSAATTSAPRPVVEGRSDGLSAGAGRGGRFSGRCR